MTAPLTPEQERAIRKGVSLSGCTIAETKALLVALDASREQVAELALEIDECNEKARLLCVDLGIDGEARSELSRIIALRDLPPGAPAPEGEGEAYAVAVDIHRKAAGAGFANAYFRAMKIAEEQSDSDVDSLLASIAGKETLRETNERLTHELSTARAHVAEFEAALTEAVACRENLQGQISQLVRDVPVMNRQHAETQAALTACDDALASVEWAAEYQGDACCPSCRGDGPREYPVKEEGWHNPYCKLVAARAKASAALRGEPTP